MAQANVANLAAQLAPQRTSGMVETCVLDVKSAACMTVLKQAEGCQAANRPDVASIPVQITLPPDPYVQQQAGVICCW